MAKQRIQLIETLIQRDPTYKPPTGAGAGGGESAAVLAAAGAANCGRCCELRPQSLLYCLAVATCRLHPPRRCGWPANLLALILCWPFLYCTVMPPSTRPSQPPLCSLNPPSLLHPRIPSSPRPSLCRLPPRAQMEEDIHPHPRLPRLQLHRADHRPPRQHPEAHAVGDQHQDCHPRQRWVGAGGCWWVGAGGCWGRGWVGTGPGGSCRL